MSSRVCGGRSAGRTTEAAAGSHVGTGELPGAKMTGRGDFDGRSPLRLRCGLQEEAPSAEDADRFCDGTDETPQDSEPCQCLHRQAHGRDDVLASCFCWWTWFFWW